MLITGLAFIRVLAERPKLSDGGHETRRWQPRRPAAVRCSARLCKKSRIVLNMWLARASDKHESSSRPGRVHLDTATIEGRADLPVGPNLSASERSDVGGNAGKNIAPLVLSNIWAVRQHRPTLVVVSRACCPNQFLQPFVGGFV